MNSEEAFLFATFKEFYKCWKSGTKARVIIEAVNGKAFVNFSAFLGDPDDAHFKPRPSKWNPSKGPRKKSDNKIKRDNDRAARYQERRRREEAASASTSTPLGNPEANVTSSLSSAAATASKMATETSASKESKFDFSEPTRENLSFLDNSDGVNLNLDGNVTLNESEVSQDIKEVSSNTQKQLQLDAQQAMQLKRMQQAQFEAITSREIEYSKKFQKVESLMEDTRQQELQLKDDIEMLKECLTVEANNLALPRKISSKIHKYLNEATTMDCMELIHGFEDIVQRYYDEYERRKKNSSSTKPTRYRVFPDQD